MSNLQTDNSEAGEAAIERKSPGLLRSSGIVGALTMVSRVLGLVRDVILATFFGATAGADAFFIAFKIPNFFRRLFAEGAFSQAFVPVLSEYRQTRDPQAVRDFVDHVAGSLALVLALVTLLGVIFAPWIVLVFAPGYYASPEKLALTGDLLRITFPYLLLISLTAFAGAVLNSHGRFAVPAITPVFLNLCLIGGALWFTGWFEQPVVGLAWAVFLAGVVQLAIQAPALSRIGLLPRPRPDFRDQGVRRVLKLMVPALFAVSVTQINLMLDTILASFLPTGSISWLFYSDRLSELPLGVFGIAIATVILPGLSRQHAADSVDHFSQTLDWALRLVLLIGIPSALALMVLAAPILTTLFQYGALTPFDVQMSAQSLVAYSVGLTAFMLVKVLAPGYFARQDMKTPVGIAVKAMVANMVLNLLLVWPLAHAGLALATSLAALLNAGLLFRGLRQRDVYRPGPGWRRFAVQLLCANLAMVVVLLLMTPALAAWQDWGWQRRALEMALLCGAGALTYFVALLAGGVRLRDFRGRSV